MNGTTVPRLHLIGPLDVVTPDDFVRVAVRAVRGGCDAVHIRLPGSAGGEVLRTVRQLKCELPETTALFVNDRLDVAMLAEATGVQLGEQSFAVGESRSLLDDHTLIGRSVHDAEGAGQAESDGADFLLAGHVYTTPSKEGQSGRGLDWLAEIARAVDTPVIALGGITARRVPDVLVAGAHGVAVGRELLTAQDPAEVAGEIRARLDASS